MSVEHKDSSVANMDFEDSKISYKRHPMDPSKPRFSVHNFKENPFRLATVSLGVLCVLLFAALVDGKAQLRQSETMLTTSNAALTKELQQINTTVVKLQSNTEQPSTAKDLLQVQFEQAVKLKTTLDSNCKTLSAERNILQNSFNNVTRVKDQLQLSYNMLMTDLEKLEKRLHVTSTEKDQTEASHVDATSGKNLLQHMYNILVKATEQLNSSYKSLLMEKQELESCESVRVERNSRLQVAELNATLAVKRCPLGWPSYKGSCYFTSTTKMNWQNSSDNCKSKGADLVIITSREEMTFINGLYYSDKEVWIGLSDVSREGNWTWVDGTPLNHNASFWAAGQPNSSPSRDQDCVEFWHRTRGHGRWNDESCHIEQFWICEKLRQ